MSLEKFVKNGMAAQEAVDEIISDERIKQIEEAYAKMKYRGWGFVSNGQGFGDPEASFTGVGPIDDRGLVTILAMDHDPVEAVRKAIENVESKR